ncbi:MAG: CBS domain-containing protein [Nitrososphaeria archaeon]|nr:CBS domain-containing protein [Nitrososphaeria archaeon]NIN53288.1 CBS domain-containing protein [Nitrososphaeria archaeon]NIQ33741.1 CBS domain-containing protein [Nitrososphaeria archaeon]
MIVAHPDETVHEALDRLYERDIGRLPVVDREDPNRLIGIISRSDIIRAFEIGKERPVE